ncbi:Grx4 family monothiol glutaredoxin [Wolbachia endosymbiont of Cruorifilaria tuberocauda]|uniref:Grx4 family monothiol glutaredoxin n=1 Tax=Wolbachia endosymbiont of Cruorifilaria tuberocauda TaxID=1812111 RepID=UPI00158B374A|nr:Grx4 family monothiol glutaredoxin [Wolbachia endosymbiont of Cruorifilaria tuberocauda]QKX01648.1 Grx4 family monothiol glutaredoxin [Wolbachia endosymbiont of Cruorifilaria tuberocauda]
MKNFEQIRKDIIENDVLLYMKGTSDFPQCGFSGLVVSILKKLNVKFKYINVLEDNEIRQSIKEFSDWPTIPQLYIKGEFIGGSDITREMYEKGELQSLLKEKEIIT